MNAKLCTVGLILGALAFSSGCHKPRDEAKPDEAKKEAPALAKPAQGDGTEEPAATAHPEANKALEDADEHGPEPVRKDDDSDDSPKTHEGRHRASSGPQATHERSADEATSPLTVKRILFSEDIDKREPVSPEETFSAAQTDKVYAFVELGNATKEKAQVTVTFVPPMGAPTKVDLKVGSKPRWRTWAKRAKPKAVGTWAVVVTDNKGTEIGRRTFEVTE